MGDGSQGTDNTSKQSGSVDDALNQPDPGSSNDSETSQSTLGDSGSGISIMDELRSESVETVFENKDLVRPDTIIDEDRIVGRDEQLKTVITNLKPALHGKGIPDMLLTGPSGTGKSLIIHAVCKQIVELSESQGMRFGVFSINCEGPGTTSRAVYRLIQEATLGIDEEPGVPESGVSTDQKLERLWEIMRDHYDGVIFVLDEIDMLDGPYSDPEYNSLLYQLSRARDLGRYDGPVSVTAITNYVDFMSDLNSRANSSFNPDEVFFDDYDATQLRHILRNREDAFKEDTLDEDVVPLVAAFGSQTHGDARKAIDLLRWSGELADKQGAEMVNETHVRTAQDRYDSDRKLRHIGGLSTQKKLCIFAVAATDYYSNADVDWIPAGPSYKLYQFICDTLDADSYGRETFVNHVTEQATYGILNFDRRGRGRGKGIHMHFDLAEDPESIMERIFEDGRFGELEYEEEPMRTITKSQMKSFLS
jgi:cell division control protein 6